MRRIMEDTVDKMGQLSPGQKIELRALLEKYEDVFSSRPGEFKGIRCSLETAFQRQRENYSI